MDILVGASKVAPTFLIGCRNQPIVKPMKFSSYWFFSRSWSVIKFDASFRSPHSSFNRWAVVWCRKISCSFHSESRFGSFQIPVMSSDEPSSSNLFLNGFADVSAYKDVRNPPDHRWANWFRPVFFRLGCLFERCETDSFIEWSVSFQWSWFSDELRSSASPNGHDSWEDSAQVRWPLGGRMMNLKFILVWIQYWNKKMYAVIWALSLGERRITTKKSNNWSMWMIFYLNAL